MSTMVTSMLIFGAFGALAGLGMINVMALVARSKNRPNDTVAFASDRPVGDIVANWAQQEGYRLVRTEAATRVYKRGRNLLTAPAFVEHTADGERHTLKAYVQINGLLAKGDIALSGGGFLVKLPRMMAHSAVNRLLTTLGQAPLPK